MQNNSVLVEYFKTLGINCMLLSRKKKLLTSCPSFCLYALFQALDQSTKHYVGVQDLDQYLKNHNIETTDDQIFYIYKTLDVRRAGAIEMSDLALFLSVAPNAQKGHSANVPPEVDARMSDIFKQLIQNYQKLQEAKALFSKSDSAAAILEILAGRPVKALGFEDLKAYLVRNGLASAQLFQEIQRELRGQGIQELTAVSLSQLLEIQAGAKQSTKAPMDPKLYQPKSAGLAQVDLSSFQHEREYLKDLREMRTQIMKKINKRRDSEHISAPNTGITAQLKREHKARPQCVSMARSSSVARLDRQEAPHYQRIYERAGHQARRKIQQIQQKARNKASAWQAQSKHLPQQTHSRKKWSNQNQSAQSTIFEYDKALLEERTRRIELEKELNRSRSEILELKKQLLEKVQDLDDATDYVLKESPHNYSYKTSTQPFMASTFKTSGWTDTNNQGLATAFTIESRSAVKQASHASYGRNLQSCLYNSSTDQLQQALRRSRIQREFAKFKLEAGRFKSANKFR